MIRPPTRFVINTRTRTRMTSNTVIFLCIAAIIIIQSPVNNSPPINTIIISPTGKIQPPTNLARPTLSIECIATLLAAAPPPIHIPAKIPSKINFPSGSFAFPTAALIFPSII